MSLNSFKTQTPKTELMLETSVEKTQKREFTSRPEGHCIAAQKSSVGNVENVKWQSASPL